MVQSCLGCGDVRDVGNILTDEFISPRGEDLKSFQILLSYNSAPEKSVLGKIYPKLHPLKQFSNLYISTNFGILISS